MSNTSKLNDQAEARFRKVQQARDSEQARAQYEAEGRALRERTERLRALRLARDAALAAAAVAAVPAKRIRPVARSRKSSVG